ncbi:MAG: hypothetical protein HYU59_12270 [Magnetospirillum gryphiswaldense]|nr:hypothetical protein [Magnetospirillum gryphiswaldense]
MKVPSMILAAALCCAGATASADEPACYGSALLKAWKQGHVAFEAGQYDHAYATLLPLAENGFAPAQWLVGRMTAEGQGTAKDKSAGWMWLKLAGQRELGLARPHARTVENQLDATTYDNARRQAENWKPKWSPACEQQKAWEISLSTPKDSSINLEDMARWWTALIRMTRKNHTDAAAYLLTQPRIMFAELDQNAGVERSKKGDNLVIVSTRMRDLPLSEAAGRILPVVRESVNDIALRTIGPMPNITYKGRILRGYAAEDNEPFLDMMRRAIDQTETLPPSLKAKTQLIREIRYEPNFTYGVSLYNQMGTVFVEDDRMPGRGYLSFRLSPQRQSVANAVLGMVGSATFAAHPGQPDSDAMQCQIAIDKFQAVKAMKLEPRYLEAYSAAIKKRNCIK